MTSMTRHPSHCDFIENTPAAGKRVVMNPISGQRERSHRKKNARKTLEFRCIFFLTFVFFLFAAALERLMPWRWLADSPERKPRASLIQEAWTAAGTCTAYAFMG